ncbi:MAG: U32 family peptidase [Paludibacteraceae bacterium]
MRKTELLSPAKNLECGLAAINHGADAVYIGAPLFSARASAGNSIADIQSLAYYAHRFRAKVLVALNTILTEAQLTEAEKLIKQIYEAGADALIVQDMGILKLNIPPIALHASTQMDNRTTEKVRFLQDVGFERAVLARELTLNQVKDIRKSTDIELECFIHGALCVSYSGQCYISHAMKGRSANRGECAQYCRLPYTLTDTNGYVLGKNKHLLSLKDLDMSEHLEELINAGITSFKIEGRLKDIDYVKNITAFYRKKLDKILNQPHEPQKEEIRKASLGNTTLFFEPNPEKSFRRGTTDYFFSGRKNLSSQEKQKGNIVQFDTPKSLGEEMGAITFVGSHFIEIKTEKEIHNGDGFCFLDKKGLLQGFRINRAEPFCQKISSQKELKKWKLFPAEMPDIENNTLVFRNQDHEFEKTLSGKTSERKIGIDILFSETNNGFAIRITDEESVSVTMNVETDKQPAKNSEVARQNILNQLTKLGNTIYEAKNITIETEAHWFIPASLLNEWRRQAIALLDTEREQKYQRTTRKTPVTTAKFPETNLTYLGNVINSKAKAFYRQFGVQEMSPGFEVKAEANVPLMYCKYCIKYAMGWCPKEGYRGTFKEPLFLQHNDEKFRLEFDCKKCEMQVISV